MSRSQSIVPAKLKLLAERWNYSPGVLNGTQLFIGGIVGARPEDLSFPSDPEEQIVQMFENMRLVLEEAGADFSHLVSSTGYAVDVELFKIWGQVKARYVKEPYPCSAGVVVAGLALPEMLVEITAVAMLDAPL